MIIGHPIIHLGKLDESPLDKIDFQIFLNAIELKALIDAVKTSPRKNQKVPQRFLKTAKENYKILMARRRSHASKKAWDTMRERAKNPRIAKVEIPSEVPECPTK